jgi:hypothetical protein
MNNKFNGEGVYTYKDGKVFYGTFKNGKKNGQGRIEF